MRVGSRYHERYVVLAACFAGVFVCVKYAAGEAAPAVLWFGAGAVIVARLPASMSGAVVVYASSFVCVVGDAASCPAESVRVVTPVPIGAGGVVVAYGPARRAVQPGVWEFDPPLAFSLVACPVGSVVLAGVALDAPGLWESVLGHADSALPGDG